MYNPFGGCLDTLFARYELVVCCSGGCCFTVTVRRRQAVKILILNSDKKETPMDIHVGKATTLTGKPVDTAGADAPIEGIQSWTVTPTSGLNLFPASDGATCEAVGMLAGVYTVQSSADGNLDPAITREITGTTQITVLDSFPDSAVGINITAGPEHDPV
jgi:hypothetical protein